MSRIAAAFMFSSRCFTLEVPGTFKRAYAVRAAKPLEIRKRTGYSQVLAPELADYELDVLEP